MLTLLASAVWFGWRWPHTSFWYDETVTAYAATQSWSGLLRWTAIDFLQLPLYLGGLKLWLTPFSGAPIEAFEFALRATSVFFAFLSLAGMLALGKRLAGRLGGVAATLILLTLPAFVYLTFEVRVYGFAFAAFTWSYVFLWALLDRYGDPAKPLDRRFWGHLLLYVGALDVALYAHYNAILALPVQALLILAYVLRNARRSDKGAWRRPILIGLLAGALIGLIYLPWLPNAIRGSSLTRFYFEGKLTFEQSQAILLNFVATGQDTIAGQNKWISNAILGVVLACALLWLIFRGRPGLLLFALAAAFIPAGILMLVVSQQAKLTGRYAWVMWIGLVLTGALGVAALRLPRRWGVLRWLPSALLLGVIMSALWLSGVVIAGHNSDLRGVFGYIRTQWVAGDLVALRDGTLFTAAEFYDSPKPYLGLPDDPITDTRHVLHITEAAAALRQQPDSIRRVWLVAWQGDVMDPQAVSSGILETLGTVQPVSGEHGFGDVSLLLYTLSKPLSSFQTPTLTAEAALPLPDGLTLQSMELLAPLQVSPGETITLHTWWLRRDTPDNELRVSIRLVGSDSKTYSQIDQPPAGWLFWSNKWTPGQLVLGRYPIITPAEMPSGEADVQLVVYSAVNSFSPVILKVGSIHVK